MHLLDLAALLPDGVEGLLAVPGKIDGQLLAGVRLLPCEHDRSARLSWEQVVLPRLAARSGASAIHTAAASAPLFSRVPVILSPAEPVVQGLPVARGSRLRRAFGRGGLAAAHTLLWPGDLPSPMVRGPQVRRLPPVVHPAVVPAPRPLQDGDRGYIAAFIPSQDEPWVSALIETWRWAGPAMGEDWALRVACPSSANQVRFAARLESARLAAGLPGVVLAEPVSRPQALANLFAGARAVLHLGPISAWGDPLLCSLAAGCPVAAEETWGVSDRVGPAAYLAPQDDRRALGAAILTLLVEDSLAEKVSRSALERAAGWDRSTFSKQLGEIYAVTRAAPNRAA